MLPGFTRGSPFTEAIFAFSAMGGALVVGLALHFVLTRIVKRLARRTRTNLDDLLIDAISKPALAVVVLQGAFLALTAVSFLDRWQGYVNKAWIVFTGGVAIYGIQRLLDALLRWYGTEIAARGRGRFDDKLMPLVRRFATLFVYGVGALLILDNLGLRLSPLLAGLGLGGLAVALAVQPTLSSLIASAYMVADGAIKVGDFIELQDGPSGTVVDVGWRSSKLRTPTNNLVIVPNNKLADTIVTNYMAPNSEVAIFPACGVSYESDLRRVEEVALDEANRLIQDLPSDIVVKDFSPVFLFSGFGDSNINFWLVLRAKDRGASFTLTHELVKRLHARFATEGIEINYPVRKIFLAAQETKAASLLVQEPTS